MAKPLKLQIYLNKNVSAAEPTPTANGHLYNVVGGPLSAFDERESNENITAFKKYTDFDPEILLI